MSYYKAIWEEQFQYISEYIHNVDIQQTFQYFSSNVDRIIFQLYSSINSI